MLFDDSLKKTLFVLEGYSVTDRKMKKVVIKEAHIKYFIDSIEDILYEFKTVVSELDYDTKKALLNALVKAHSELMNAYKVYIAKEDAYDFIRQGLPVRWLNADLSKELGEEENNNEDEPQV